MKIVIVGMGKSGEGAKMLCEHFGYEYECIDAERGKGLPERLFIPDADLYVVSPGIPTNHPQIRHAIVQNIPWIGEAAFALKHAKQRVIGITGTNGKTTVTSLLAHVLHNALACGNIGLTLSQAVIESDANTTLVAELSSYQLETMTEPVLSCGAILNISPDHLNRYKTMNKYVRAKLRIKHALKEGAPLFVDEGTYVQWKKEIPDALIVPPFKKRLAEVSSLNAAFALALSSLTEDAFFTKALTFKKPPHRIEFVKILDGISFYDDSKGTNVAAVLFSLAQFSERVVLIAGGQGKGESFSPLKAGLKAKVKCIVALGETKEQIHKELSSVVPVEMVLTLEEAVQKAYATAGRGDVVLLSPGCASLDMFKDYVDRGKKFKACVDLLESKSRKEEQTTLF